ncbi:MAG: NAD(P)/FAD-dependent oxidoreductase [Anaerolineae bacterium]|nr:NAD(P)/FAD-dependent oxidoreductase [Anaerolineae bacterium]
MNIAVIGAGYGGMAAAYDLNKAGHKVTIFEAADYVGGLARGFKEPHWDWSVEQFYHHWFQSDKDMLGLINELGLSQNVFFPRPKTVVYYNEKFYPLDSPLAALVFPGFSFPDMVRFGLVTVYLRFLANWRNLEHHTAYDWIKKYYGESLYKTMFEPLLVGKFGEHYKEVNMAWFWARFKTRTTRLGTYKGGFQAFSDDFAAILRQMGIDIQLSTPISRIESAPQGGINLTLPGGEQHFDQVLVTSSPGLLARLAPGLPSDYLGGLLNLKHMGAVVLVLSIKQQLSKEGYYWYSLPKSAGYPFLAMVEHTNYLPAERFGGEHILYCGDYLDNGHEYFSMDKEELVERFTPSLRRFNPDFSADWINKSWLFKAEYAQPIPLLDHSKNIPAIRTPIPGLYFASMSQVYPWDRGTNFAVQIGRQAARLMLSND